MLEWLGIIDNRKWILHKAHKGLLARTRGYWGEWSSDGGF